MGFIQFQYNLPVIMNRWIAHLSFLICIGLFIISVFMVQDRFEGLEVLTFDLSQIKPQSVYDPLFFVKPEYEGIHLKDTSLCDKYKLYLTGLDGESITNGASSAYHFDKAHPMGLHTIFFNESSHVTYQDHLISMTSEQSINLPITRDQFTAVINQMADVRFDCISLVVLYLFGIIILGSYCIITWHCDIFEDALVFSGFFSLAMFIASCFLVYCGVVVAQAGTGVQKLLANEFTNRSLLYGITVVENETFAALLYVLAWGPLIVALLSIGYTIYSKVKDEEYYI